MIGHRSAHPGGLQGVRILFVDDEPSIRRSFVRTLERHGQRVDTASSPFEAIRKVQQNAYPVVVTDVRMRGMDGFSLIERLTEIRRDTVFVIVSGMPDLDRSRTHEANVAAIVPKPWTAKELLAAIDEAWAQWQQTQSPPQGDRNIAHARTLIVEDDPFDLAIVERHLLRAGFQASLLENAPTLDDALRALYRDAFDLILVDLHLPDFSGVEVVSRIHATAPDSTVVVLSGEPEDTVGIRAVQLGAQDFISKTEVSGAGFLRAVRYGLERKRAERRLSRLGHFDIITGLANRFTFLSRLSKRVSEAQERGVDFGIIAVDLDRFKHVNDSLGHDAGDLLLREVGARLQGHIREGDVVARLGGDDFAILLDNVSGPSAVMSLARHLLAIVRRPVVVSDETIIPSCSIGVAVFPTDGSTADELLGAADQSMYAAKRAGRDRIVLASDDEPRRRSSAKLLLTSALENALRRGDFELHYQPQFSLSGGELVGFEGLLRLHDGDELVRPSDFIPMLEEGGGILAVGRWVIDQACRQLSEWVALGGRPLRMAVNLSTVQLEDPVFCQAVEASLRVHGLSPEQLELEITESILMQETDRSQRTLEKLKETGVRLAIDDFGTGYSSLAYLHRFEVDLLKIDRTFVAPLGTASANDSHRIARAILELGRSLQMELLAEGVETEPQLDYLRRRGCHLVQGHLLGRPQKAEDAEAWVRTPPAAAAAN